MVGNCVCWINDVGNGWCNGLELVLIIIQKEELLMQNFDFFNPTHIVFGKDRLKELNNLIPKNAKILVLFGGGSIKKFGTLKKSH